MQFRRLVLVPIALLAISERARAADQMVVFDEVYTQELNGNVPGETFHHGIAPKPTEPDSWLAPVAYAKGTAYLYLEILAKPSKRDTILTVCFDGPRAGYGCLDSKTYTDLGAYETVVAMKDGPVWQYNQIAWGKRRDDYHLVIKDPALGGTQGGKPASDYVPTRLRAVLTIVPPGGTYVAPAKGSGGGADGGAIADAAEPISSADAAMAPTGGAGGAADGGASGSPSGGSAGGATGGTSGASTGGMTAEPTPTGGTSGTSATTVAGRHSSGGCSTGAGGARTGAGLMMVALVALLRRRRR